MEAPDLVVESLLETAESRPRDPAHLRSEASAEMLQQIKRLSKIVRMSRTSKLHTDLSGELAEAPARSFEGAARVFRPL